MPAKRGVQAQPPTRRSARIAASSRASSVDPEQAPNALQTSSAADEDIENQPIAAAEPSKPARSKFGTRAKISKILPPLSNAAIAYSAPFSISSALSNFKRSGVTYWRTLTDHQQEELAVAMSDQLAEQDSRLQYATLKLQAAQSTIDHFDERDVTRERRKDLDKREKAFLARYPQFKNKFSTTPEPQQVTAPKASQESSSSQEQSSEPNRKAPQAPSHASSSSRHDSAHSPSKSTGSVAAPKPVPHQAHILRSPPQEQDEDASTEISSLFSQPNLPAYESTPLQALKVSHIIPQAAVPASAPAKSSLFRRVIERISSPFIGRTQSVSTSPQNKQTESPLQPLPESRKRSAPDDEDNVDPDSPLQSRNKRHQASVQSASSSPVQPRAQHHQDAVQSASSTPQVMSTPTPHYNAPEPASGRTEQSISSSASRHYEQDYEQDYEPSSQSQSVQLTTPASKRLKAFHLPSSRRPDIESSLSTVIEYTEPLSGIEHMDVEATPTRPVPQTVSSQRYTSHQTPRARSINQVRRVQSERKHSGRPPNRMWTAPPAPREPNADRRLEKLKRYQKIEAELDSLREDDDLRELGLARAVRVNVNTLRRIPHRRPGDPSGTFRVPDIDSDDEMEVDEEDISYKSNVFEEDKANEDASGVMPTPAVAAPQVSVPAAAVVDVTTTTTISPTPTARPPIPGAFSPPSSSGISPAALPHQQQQQQQQQQGELPHSHPATHAAASAFLARWGGAGASGAVIPDGYLTPTIPLRRADDVDSPEFIAAAGAKFLRSFQHWKLTGEIVGYGRTPFPGEE